MRLKGVMQRRMLINYRVDAAVLGRLLPAPFVPWTVGGFGIAGICLVRLQVVPPGVPAWMGVTTENAAYRVAVRWGERVGVFIARRATSSGLNAALSGRLLAQPQQRARFMVDESDSTYAISIAGDGCDLAIEARTAERCPADSVFASPAHASTFFAAGSVAFACQRDGSLDAVELTAPPWQATPLEVTSLASSYHDDRRRFPSGSITFDSAFVVRDLPHRWRTIPRESALTPG